MDALRRNCAYKVISHSAPDGFHVDHFPTEQEARGFAADAAAAGFHCVVCRMIDAAGGAA